ncbi:MAG: DUF4331 family protein [Acidimicrobiia bacterium]
MRKPIAVGIGALLLAAGAITAVLRVDAADHRDAPIVETDPSLDINDVYAFQSPADADKTVLIMTVNPLAGMEAPTTFSEDGKYVLNVDNDGDAVADKKLTTTFGHVRQDGSQRVKLVGAGVKAKGSTGEDVRTRRGGTLHAGLFDDPFFFDLAAFQNGLMFCPGGMGTNFFAGLNVTAIVAEVPSNRLTDETSNIGVWGTTKNNGTFDRMGRPAINTVFLPSDMKEAFNDGKPKDDQANFRDEVVATLLALGNSQSTADMLADVLLPDILTVDVSSTSGFLNGRQLSDDVIDAELNLITGGGVTTDCVANDSTFPGTFPYLAAPNLP